jgi:hypothetical protein
MQNDRDIMEVIHLYHRVFNIPEVQRSASGVNLSDVASFTNVNKSTAHTSIQ